MVSAIGMACDCILKRLRAGEGQLDPQAALESFDQSSMKKYMEWESSLAGERGEKWAAFGFGAEFVEVRISRFTWEVRVPRTLAAFSRL